MLVFIKMIHTFFSLFADELFVSEHEDKALRDIGASSKAAVTMFELIIHFDLYKFLLNNRNRTHIH